MNYNMEYYMQIGYNTMGILNNLDIAEKLTEYKHFNNVHDLIKYIERL